MAELDIPAFYRGAVREARGTCPRERLAGPALARTMSGRVDATVDALPAAPYAVADRCSRPGRISTLA